ncbi:nucleotidyltransferase family protein [Aerococcus kribbianus]|uniref:Nucleotidyltransferase family protein n=1 Tax=Aerococcus kribbianus TaxID=2999064 RepID=A0A9X3FQD5_9LACT|nr:MULTISPECIES: nucleotidyltransferase family protein [unclassified Aerococcus]MCZ0717779.1 nucleotidyltransferase family protein [Aerococcus sp. YH-aer221]MCZ0726066.1 nucleotidyltransferase family protein [Aerococcus sp. YH-aer222]
MKALILAAGYATRLYPLTKDTPKALLEVAGQTIMDHIVSKIDLVDAIDEIIIVSNDKFADNFQAWAKQADYSKKLTVLNDGTLTNETRLGAIGDIHFVSQELTLNDDLMVLAGDNLFDFDLRDFVAFFQERGTDVIAAYEESDQEQLTRGGVVKIDDQERAIAFAEKKPAPISNLSVPTFYIFQASTLSLIADYLAAGNNPDAPGHFMPYLLEEKPVSVFVFSGGRYDIGTLASYEQVQEIFAQRNR